jgi:hypothetical protein
MSFWWLRLRLRLYHLKKTDSLYWDHPVRRESAKMVERTDQLVLILKFKGCCDRVAPNTPGTRGGKWGKYDQR